MLYNFWNYFSFDSDDFFVHFSFNLVYTYLFPQLSIFLNVKRVLITAIYFWYNYIYNQ